MRTFNKCGAFENCKKKKRKKTEKKKKRKTKRMSVNANGSEVAASEAPRHDAGGAVDAAAAAHDGRTRPKTTRAKPDASKTLPLGREARRGVQAAQAAVSGKATGVYTSAASDASGVGALQRGVQLREMAVASMNAVSAFVERLVDMVMSGTLSNMEKDHYRQAIDTLQAARYEGQSEAGRQAAANSLSRVRCFSFFFFD
jgi:hypothetical protein